MPDDAAERQYALGPAEPRGVVYGLTAAQTGILAGGLLAVVALVRAQQVGAAVLVVAAAGLAAFGALHGRPIYEWAPLAAAYLTDRALGRHRYRNPAAHIGHLPDGSLAAPATPPPELQGVRLLAVARDDGREAGVLVDSTTGAYVAVLVVTVRGYPLLDVAEQQRRLRAWAEMVEYLAREGSSLRRLQWLERTVPDDGSGLDAYLAASKDPSLADDHPAVGSYAQLIAQAAPTGHQHQLLLAAALDPRRAAARIRRAGGGAAGAAAVLLTETQTLGARLEASDLDVDHVDGLLTPGALARLMSVAYNPAQPAAALPVAEGAVAPTADAPGSGATHAAWPQAAEVGWDVYRTAGAAWHRTFWIAEWPRVGAHANFLLPLLLVNVTRAISVTLEPVSRHQAERAVTSAQTSEEADSELRARAGFRDSARKRQQRAHAAQREQELADGHTDVRFSGYVCVTAPDREALERACAEVQAAAYQARCVLQPCDAQQPQAFTWAALPLARGLR